MNFDDVDWEISLSDSPNMTLDLDGGAANVNVDLSKLQVTELDVNVGAAEFEVTMPANAGHVNAEIDGGAADIRIVIPEGVAARKCFQPPKRILNRSPQIPVAVAMRVVVELLAIFHFLRLRGDASEARGNPVQQ